MHVLGPRNDEKLLARNSGTHAPGPKPADSHCSKQARFREGVFLSTTLVSVRDWKASMVSSTESTDTSEPSSAIFAGNSEMSSWALAGIWVAQQYPEMM